MSLFSRPNGSHVAGTSLSIIIDVSPLPPRPSYACGTLPVRMDPDAMSIVTNFITVSFFNSTLSH